MWESYNISDQSKRPKWSTRDTPRLKVTLFDTKLGVLLYLHNYVIHVLRNSSQYQAKAHADDHWLERISEKHEMRTSHIRTIIGFLLVFWPEFRMEHRH